jgi:Holliday junction resolvase RusA-like endonuclease
MNKPKEIKIKPIAKPRMTRRDKWLKPPRKCVSEYWAFKDELNKHNIYIDDSLNITFMIAMPKSWSKKKKRIFAGTPHKQRPDADNLVKSVLDCLLKEDSHVYKIHAEKYWDYDDKIMIW